MTKGGCDTWQLHLKLGLEQIKLWTGVSADEEILRRALSDKN